MKHKPDKQQFSKLNAKRATVSICECGRVCLQNKTKTHHTPKYCLFKSKWWNSCQIHWRRIFFCLSSHISYIHIYIAKLFDKLFHFFLFFYINCFNCLFVECQLEYGLVVECIFNQKGEISFYCCCCCFICIFRISFVWWLPTSLNTIQNWKKKTRKKNKNIYTT